MNHSDDSKAHQSCPVQSSNPSDSENFSIKRITIEGYKRSNIRKEENGRKREKFAKLLEIV